MLGLGTIYNANKTMEFCNMKKCFSSLMKSLVFLSLLFCVLLSFFFFHLSRFTWYKWNGLLLFRPPRNHLYVFIKKHKPFILYHFIHRAERKKYTQKHQVKNISYKPVKTRTMSFNEFF